MVNGEKIQSRAVTLTLNGRCPTLKFYQRSYLTEHVRVKIFRYHKHRNVAPSKKQEGDLNIFISIKHDTYIHLYFLCWLLSNGYCNNHYSTVEYLFHILPLSKWQFYTESKDQIST